MNIMTALFDQDEVTRSLVASKERRAKIATNLNAIKSIMSDFNVSLTKAMDTLKIPASERDYYIQQIEDSNDNIKH